MVTVNKLQFQQLVDEGLINFGKHEKNFTVINKQKKSRRKKYAVVETREVMKFLNRK